MKALRCPQPRRADKFLARPGRTQTTATKDFDVHISYLLS